MVVGGEESMVGWWPLRSCTIRCRSWTSGLAAVTEGGCERGNPDIKPGANPNHRPSNKVSSLSFSLTAATPHSRMARHDIEELAGPSLDHASKLSRYRVPRQDRSWADDPFNPPSSFCPRSAGPCSAKPGPLVSPPLPRRLLPACLPSSFCLGIAATSFDFPDFRGFLFGFLPVALSAPHRFVPSSPLPFRPPTAGPECPPPEGLAALFHCGDAPPSAPGKERKGPPLSKSTAHDLFVKAQPPEG